MLRYGRYIHLLVFVILVGLAYNPEYNPFLINDGLKMAEHTAEVTKNETILKEEIVERSPEYNVDPQDAYIDRVWKKTPGRNGLKVNIEASYEKMKKAGTFKEELLVFDEVPPSVSLNDLPASPIYRGNPEKNMVAFLINVSWGTEHIPDLLNILKEQKTRATFFIEGKWAKENPDVVKMIEEQGHLIGNHAYNHPDMARMSKQEAMDQIERTNQIIKALIEETPKWFAPPSGSFNDDVVEGAHELNMETILWTVDTIDWKNPSVNVMMNRVMTNIHPGATILMHPTSSTIQGLPLLIKEIRSEGYKIGTVEQLLSEDRD